MLGKKTTVHVQILIRFVIFMNGKEIHLAPRLLTPILTYVIFVLCHLSYVIYDKNVKYVIFDGDI